MTFLKIGTFLAVLAFLPACTANATPEIPEKDIDYVQVGWGGGMPGPVGGHIWRAYADDSVYYLTIRWRGDILLSDHIDGIYAQSVELLHAEGADVDQLDDLYTGKECLVMDYGSNHIIYTEDGVETRVESFCPPSIKNLGLFSTAFFAIYTPLRDLMHLEE